MYRDRYIKITIICYDFWSEAEADLLDKLFAADTEARKLVGLARDKKATVIEISSRLQIEGTLVKKLDQFANTIEFTVHQLSRANIDKILPKLKYHSIIDVSVSRSGDDSKTLFRGWFRSVTRKLVGGTALTFTAADEPNTGFKDNLFILNRGDVPKDLVTFYNKLLSANNTAIRGWDQVNQKFTHEVTPGQIESLVMGTVGQVPPRNVGLDTQIGFGPTGMVSDASGNRTELLLYRKGADGKQKQQFKEQAITVGNITSIMKVVEEASDENYLVYWDWGRIRYMERSKLDVLQKSPIVIGWDDGLMEEPDLNQGIVEVKYVYHPRVDIGNVINISETQLLVVELSIKFASYTGQFYTSLKCLKIDRDVLWVIKNNLMLYGTPSAQDYLDHNRIGNMLGKFR